MMLTLLEHNKEQIRLMKEKLKKEEIDFETNQQKATESMMEWIDKESANFRKRHESIPVFKILVSGKGFVSNYKI